MRKGSRGVHAMVFNLTGARPARPIAGRTLTGSRSRPRAARGRRETRSTLSTLVESLERRTYLTASPIVSGFSESDVVSLTWQGRQVEAIRDSWMVRMPQTNAATARNVADYQSTRPHVPSGWTVRDLGLGFFNISAPGQSEAAVGTWASQVGAGLQQPNLVHRKLAEIPNEGAVNPPTNPGFGSLWGLQNTGQVGALHSSPTTNVTGAGTPGSDIDVTSVWAGGVTGSRDIIIAVMDDGIDYTHTDLQANMWSRPANVPASRYGLHGWDSADDDADIRSANLTDAHGTHVAGTIGAVGDNGEGISGVMQEVQLYGAKVFGDGSPGAASADIIDAINRVVELRATYGQNIVAINASLGGVGPENPAETSAIAAAGAAGILFVAAAGNGGRDGIGDNNDVTPVFPANTPLPNVISVAASNRRDELTVFSNWGQGVHIAAPGSGIWSTVPGDAYDQYQGTSMAAPHVAGVAGLIASAFLDQTGSLPTVSELRTAILNGADVIDTVAGVSGLTNATTRGTVNGNRRLNALGALDYLLGAEVSVQAARPSGREGASDTSSVEFTIRLARPATIEPVEVTFATADDTAVAGEDYVATSGTVTFEPGQQVKTVSVLVMGDRTLEQDETFTFSLTGIENGRLGIQRVSPYTILNDEPPLVSIKPAVVVEKNGQRVSADFEISTVGDPMAPVMVSYTTRDGTAVARRDYVPTQGTLVFLPGETTKRISVKVVGDRDVEDDEMFSLVVVGIRNGMLDEESIAVPGFIVDDDSRVVSVTAMSPSVRGGDDAVFRVALERIGGFTAVFPSIPAGLELPEFVITATVGTVSQAASRSTPRALAGTDYTTVSQRLTFTAAAREHMVHVPTNSVDARRGFMMRIAGVEGASIGTATASTLILTAAGDTGADTSAGRQSGRPGSRVPIAVWRGLAGRG